MSIRDESTSTPNHWETKWIAAEGAFDPAYERTNLALRRWIDGMEAAVALSTAQGAPRTRRIDRAR